jgi:hypothetical protein
MTQVSLKVVNFEREMQRIEKEIVAIGNLEIAALVKYGTEQLKVVTPVNTGKARKGWDSKINFTPRGRFLSGTIFNQVEYIDVLNRGHSQQAPSYFIEQTLSRIGLITPV